MASLGAGTHCRYDYWRKNSSTGKFDHQHEELSAWSPSGAADFHLPQFFGTANLV